MNSGKAKEIYGGFSVNGSAFENTVIINDGEVTSNLYGGSSDKSDAINNTVEIHGGTFNGTSAQNIYGGYAGSTTPHWAESNAVFLSGAPVFSNPDGVNIYGGWSGSTINDLRSAFRGNMLVLGNPNLGGYKGTSTIKKVEGFEVFGFILDEDSKPLVVKDITFGDRAGRKSYVSFINTIGSYDPQKDAEIHLIEATTMNADGFDAREVTGEQMGGANAVTYKWNVQVMGTNLVATLLEKIGGGAKTETKSLLEGRLAGTVALTQAADMLAGQGMSAMLASVSQSSFSTWGAIGGGTNRYNTGSHINSDGIGFMVGAAWRKCTGPGTLALSPFFAFGWGNYTSHNAFSGIGSVKGKGNTNYQGGGLMARYSHTNTGWYGEASVQLGHVKQDYKSSDFRTTDDKDTKYTINQMYTSMHFGIGKEIALSNCSVLDVYGKYFWTHTGKKDRKIAEDVYKFAAVNSHRARFGARYTYTKATGSGEVKPYAGAAYEYEFNGKGRGTANGFRIADTRLQGSTGLLEAGIDYAPNSKKWAINGGVTGFVGKRRGIMGQLGVRADF